jgi:hypothetical protein
MVLCGVQRGRFEGHGMRIISWARYEVSGTAEYQPSIWTAIEFAAPVDSSDALAADLSDVLLLPSWYANWNSDTEATIVFPGRILADGSIGPVDAAQVPRYVGEATFARLPRIAEVERADVAVLGVLFDSGVSYRPGRASALAISGSRPGCCGPTTRPFRYRRSPASR